MTLMDYAAAVALLPGDYALAILLDDAGAEPDVIARRLDIDMEAVASMLDLARAKLTPLLARPGNVAAVPGDGDEQDLHER
jgi:DNA-directed RNA polymerase specialized sigma24 family protein